MPRKGENKIKMKEEKNSEEMEVDKCDKKGKTKKPETPKEYTNNINNNKLSAVFTNTFVNNITFLSEILRRHSKLCRERGQNVLKLFIIVPPPTLPKLRHFYNAL